MFSDFLAPGSRLNYVFTLASGDGGLYGRPFIIIRARNRINNCSGELLQNRAFQKVLPGTLNA